MWCFLVGFGASNSRPLLYFLLGLLLAPSYWPICINPVFKLFLASRFWWVIIMSSAYITLFAFCVGVRSVVMMLNNKGLQFEPCGSPLVVFSSADLFHIVIWYDLSFKKLRVHLSVVSVIPGFAAFYICIMVDYQMLSLNLGLWSELIFSLWRLCWYGSQLCVLYQLLNYLV